MFSSSSFATAFAILSFCLLATAGCSSEPQKKTEVKLADLENVQAIVNRVIALQDQYEVLLLDDAKSVQASCTPYDADKHKDINLAHIAGPLVSVTQASVRPIRTTLPFLYLSSREASFDGVPVTRQQLTSIIETKLQQEKNSRDLVIVLAADVSKADFLAVVKSLANVKHLAGIMLVGSASGENP